MGDGAEILDEFLASHTHTTVGKRDCLGLLVESQSDLEIRSRILEMFFRPLEVADFFHRIGGVGN